MSYILFAALFVYLTNWQAVLAFFRGSFTSKSKSVPYENQKLESIIFAKTGIRFRYKKARANYYFGFSLLIPKNTIILSSRIIDDLTLSELEWLVLHEAGHRLYWHGVKSVVITLVFLVVGLWLLRIVNPIILAFGLTIIYQQIHRYFELQTDRYAATHMENPKAMITANAKFTKVSTSVIYKSDILRTLFTPHLSYDQRAKLARQYI